MTKVKYFAGENIGLNITVSGVVSLYSGFRSLLSWVAQNTDRYNSYLRFSEENEDDKKSSRLQVKAQS